MIVCPGERKRETGNGSVASGESQGKRTIRESFLIGGYS